MPGNGAVGDGVVDWFANDWGDSDLGSVGEAQTALVDQIVEVDDALMETYLEQGEVKNDQLEEPMRRAVREGHRVPICFTASRRQEDPQATIGVKEFADHHATLAPTPVARPEQQPVGIACRVRWPPQQ